MSRKRLKTSESTETPIESPASDQENSTEMVVGRILTSKLFPKEIWQTVHELETLMSGELKKLQFPKEIAAAYNPLEYADEINVVFLQRFLGNNRKQALFVGMNPGPFGMVQTGVPFGHIPSVRDWMQLSGAVRKPETEISVRPVEGFACVKEEVSGKRFWGLLAEICGPAENFFRHCFVYNYCPLAFFHATGRNITPAEIKGDSRGKLQEICNAYLAKVIHVIQPEVLVPIGRYAEDRIKELRKRDAIDRKLPVKCLPHPSPRAVNNHNWPEKARKWFDENDISKYMQRDA